MENLVLKYTSGDGCTWWADTTVPFQYESKEKFELDFFEYSYKHLEKYLISSVQERYIDSDLKFFKDHPIEIYQFWHFDDFKKKTHKFENISAWIYSNPEVYTLEEWFDAFEEKTENLSNLLDVKQ